MSRLVRMLLIVAISALAGQPAWALAEAGAGAGQDAIADEQTAPTGQNCLGEPRPKLIMHQVLGIKWGPWGIEHQLRIGGCAPLVRKPGVLFDHSFIEAGFQAHTSPIYVMPGVYVDIAPLSVLVLHFQFAPVLYWPIGLSGAGYYPLDTYQQDYSQASLPAEDGESALGWYLRTGVTLQAAVSIGPVRLLAANTFVAELWQLGEQPYYFHNRNDLPAATREWFLDNMTLVMAEIPLHPNLDLRVGVNHQLTMNLGMKQMSNFMGGVTMFRFKKLGTKLRDFTPLVRFGARSRHPLREGDFTFIVAVIFSADLLAQREMPAHREPVSAAGEGLRLGRF